MKKYPFFLLAIALFGSFSAVPALAAVKDGTNCTKKGETYFISGKKFTCTKLGNKLTWKKGSLIPSPTSFANLFQRRSGVSYTAWKYLSSNVKPELAPSSTLESFAGPNTKPWFNDLPKVIKLVSSTFRNFESPKQTLAISYNYVDLAWATNLLRTKISPQDYEELDRSEGGRLLDSNCRDKDCGGSKQLTTQGGLSILLLGVPNSMNLSDPVGDMRFLEGQLEAHEYFHSLQRVQLLGKPMTRETYPPVWFTEGSAEWVQNAVINFKSFDKYSRFIKSDCPSNCRSLSEADISKFMSTQISDATQSSFDHWLNYSLGSLIVESLVAVGGYDSLLQMNTELSKGIGWVLAFKAVYKEDWSKAYPIIAKTIAGNLRN
jgi:hypothetical protein